MKLRINKIISALILLTGIFFSLSCERDVPYGASNIDCNDCYTTRPEWGPLNVVMTINDENPFVPLIVYRGDFNDNNIEYVDTSYWTDYWVDVPVDKEYSIVAKYKKGDEIINVVDASKLSVKYTSTDCQEPCYYFSGGYMDVRLRE